LDHLRADQTSIRSALDLPSGGGRVLRFLRVAFPDAEFVACDTNEALVEFCGKALGARVARSVPDINPFAPSWQFQSDLVRVSLDNISMKRGAPPLAVFL